MVKEKAKEAEFFEEAKDKLRKEAKNHELQSSAQKLKRELLEQSLEQADRSHQEEESEFYALRIEALQLRSKVTKLEKEKVWLEHSKKSELDAMVSDKSCWRARGKEGGACLVPEARSANPSAWCTSLLRLLGKAFRRQGGAAGGA